LAMSWSVSLIGTPEKVAAAVEEYGDKLQGQSKVEYQDAAPHLAALVRQNFSTSNICVRLDASGSGYTQDGKEVSRTAAVKLETFYAGILV
jgi:hypothetical protein